MQKKSVGFRPSLKSGTRRIMTCTGSHRGGECSRARHDGVMARSIFMASGFPGDINRYSLSPRCFEHLCGCDTCSFGCAVALLLRRYWWGMLWGLSPDIIDWVILRPLTGRYQIHHLFPQVSTHWGPWSFWLEILLVVSAALLVYRLMRKQRTSA